MAAAIRQWPTEEAAGDGGRAVGDRRRDADAARRAAADGPTAASGGGARGADTTPKRNGELGRTERGRLFVRRDPRVGRPVLVEEREAPLAGAELARVQALAAAGGPHVQRILALSDDRRAVIYEAIEGRVVRVEALPAADQALLARGARHAGRHRQRTPPSPPAAR